MINSKCTEIFNYPVKTVWDIVTNNNDYTWRSDLKRIIVIANNNFVEIDKNNCETSFIITNKEMYKQYEFDMKNKNISGHWIGKFTELDKNKCEVKFIEMIEVNNFIMKLLGKIYLKKQQKRYIKDLKIKIEESSKESERNNI